VRQTRPHAASQKTASFELSQVMASRHAAIGALVIIEFG
jgi:hypothetical protein